MVNAVTVIGSGEVPELARLDAGAIDFPMTLLTLSVPRTSIIEEPKAHGRNYIGSG